ncbi:hypothetical protein [Dyella japonica]|uniref:Uncharacterized protein n=1 Tax=Dyella japonica A8 TaxID=1217721 RepID=A0A075JV65_9GAMM|nr:hypothetical protein [Dyella japonica]AIF45996.1 hypothetical protein HY57_01300 [Dyella japonica A8]
MLTPFWFHTDHGLGYGVTARSMMDAECLLRDFGYPREGELVMAIVTGITHSQLEPHHVAPNAGPIIVRGVWFPNHTFSE